MKFVKGILLLQLSSICQALFTPTTQVPPTNSSVAPDENFTQLEEHVSVNPHVEPFSGKCRWTLKMSENSFLEDVPVDAEFADRLALQICQGLGCGGVYNVKKIKHPSNSSCFSECHYEMGNLQNCSLREAKDCVVISEAVCGAHMVRLSGGWDRCAGRVELWRGGRWGSVCDDEFDLAEAQVVCRQVGCGYALDVSGQGGMFPPGTGPVLLDDLNCTGTEPNLWECPATQETETDCGHKEDAGVVCSEMKVVRLSGGLDRCSGKVEIHRNRTWGTVCDTCWNSEIASTVCSMLECGSFAKTFTQFTPPLMHNPGPLYYYHCPSSSNLWDCVEIVNKSHLCVSSNAAGVICNGSLGFTTTAKPSVTTTEIVTDVTTLNPVDSSLLSSLPLLSLSSVSLLLLVFLIVNTVLCCHYKSRHTFLVQQSQKSQSSQSKQRRNSYEDSLIKVSSNPTHDDVSTRPLWMQLSNVDRTSVEKDSFEPSFSTFHNSQRHRVGRNPLMMRPLGSDRLHEEASEPVHGEVGAFSSCNGANFRPKSRLTADSFDSSSTSSEETYTNTNHHSEGQNYTEEDEGPVYSPVSPETDTSSEDDYDDVDTA